MVLDPGIRNPESVSLILGTRFWSQDQGSGRWIPDHGIRDPEPGTRDPVPGFWNPGRPTGRSAHQPTCRPADQLTGQPAPRLPSKSYLDERRRLRRGGGGGGGKNKTSAPAPASGFLGTQNNKAGRISGCFQFRGTLKKKALDWGGRRPRQPPSKETAA